MGASGLGTAGRELLGSRCACSDAAAGTPIALLVVGTEIGEEVPVELSSDSIGPRAVPVGLREPAGQGRGAIVDTAHERVQLGRLVTLVRLERPNRGAVVPQSGRSQDGIDLLVALARGAANVGYRAPLVGGAVSLGRSRPSGEADVVLIHSTPRAGDRHCTNTLSDHIATLRYVSKEHPLRAADPICDRSV
jgi:hypothetical protein